MFAETAAQVDEGMRRYAAHAGIYVHSHHEGEGCSLLEMEKNIRADTQSQCMVQ